jgi:hypothetical protein
MDKAQAIAEVLAKLSAHERKRRQVYRSEVHGQLPFDPRGMEEPAPTLEISTSGGGEVSIGLERQDIASTSARSELELDVRLMFGLSLPGARVAGRKFVECGDVISKRATSRIRSQNGL